MLMLLSTVEEHIFLLKRTKMQDFFHKFFGGDTVAAAEPSSIPADAF